MLKKIVAVFMTVVMLVFCIPISASASNEGFYKRTVEKYKTVSNTSEVISTTEVEGIKISCKYLKNTKEYYLYFGDEQYELDVSFEGKDILFDIHQEDSNKKNTVYGQSVTLVSVGLLAPEVISAIQGCIIGITSVVGITGTAYVSVELYDNVLSSKTVSKLNVSVADAAVSAATSGVTQKTEYDNSYFEAALVDDGTVYIGRLLTYKDAIARVRIGYDVMSIDRSKAFVLASVASPVKDVDGPEIHKGKGIRYYHYHPVGVEWYLNKRHRPHVWYM